MVSGLATGMLAGLLAMLIAVPPAAAAADPELTTDSGSAALLVGADLSPGRGMENCVVLTYRNLPVGSNGLGMYAATTGTGLADYLDLIVEAGSGGGFGDCSGFDGTRVYSGSLAEFAQTHAAPASQLLLRSFTADQGSLTIKLRLKLRNNNRAQGKSATATFSWIVGGYVEPPSPPPVIPTAPPGQQPSAQPSPSVSPSASESSQGATAGPAQDPSAAGEDPSPRSEPSPESPAGTPPTGDQPPAEPGGVPEPSFSPAVQGTVESAAPEQGQPTDGVVPLPAGVGTFGPPLAAVEVPLLPDVPAQAGASPGQRGEVGLGEDSATTASKQGGSGPARGISIPAIPSPAAQLREALSEIVTAAQNAAPAAAKGGALGLVTLPFVLLFLLIQKRLDERDPKLALAPSYQDEYLSFDDLPLTRPGQSPA